MSRSRCAAALPLAALIMSLSACKGSSSDDPPPPARAWSHVSVGYGGTACAIDNRSALFCWGSAPWTGALGVGDFEPRPDPTAVASVATGWAWVSAGDQFACGVRSGALYCWGSNHDHQIDDSVEQMRPAPTRVGSAADWAEVAVGANHACARNESGALLCWGVNYNGQLGTGTKDAGKPASDPVTVTVGTGSRWVEVVAGETHTCGRRDDGSLWCWGYGSLGAVGQGAWEDSPSPFSHGAGWTRVFAGDVATCALKGSDLWCWGENANVPTPVGSGYAGASVGDSFRCRWTSGGAMECRGANDRGQLGVGTNAAQTGYVAVPDLHVVKASSGRDTTCAIVAGGGLRCWGGNDDGKVGNGTIGRKWTPTLVGAGAWNMISTGAEHTCAQSSGTGSPLFCWGANMHGQLGTGTTRYEKSPVQIGTFMSPWTNVTVGDLHTCGLAGLSVDQSTYCWGYGGWGQLGYDASSSLEPELVDSIWTSVSAGAMHTCAARGDGKSIDCFGYNSSGQLGDGTNAARFDPQPVATTAALDSPSAGAAHTCALGAGKVSCWGRNDYGQAGTGDYGDRVRPAWVQSSATDWMSVRAGSTHTCGVRGWGPATVYCWGSSVWGEAGFGPSPYRVNVPTAVAGLPVASGMAKVSAGSTSTCAIVDGQLYCFGSNYYGQLGIGLTPHYNAYGPRPVGAATWYAVSVGGNHACGINDDGLWCWGSNASGQLGDGTAWYASPQNVPLP